MHLWKYVVVQMECDIISQYITVDWLWLIYSCSLWYDNLTDELSSIFHRMLLTGLTNEYLCKGFNEETN